MSRPDTQLEKEIAALNHRPMVPWAKVGALLDRVDREKFWARDARSFSEWLKSFAPKIGVNESSLWRYLRASRYYEKLQKELAVSDNFSPSPRLHASVSAENLEILQKLERVVPKGEFDALAGRALHGVATRSELRELWKTYREILGRNARGRGVTPSRVDPANVVQRGMQMEAKTLTTLMSASPKWTGVEHPEFYRVITRAALPEGADDEARGIFDGDDSDFLAPDPFDVLALIRANEKSELKLIGVQLLSRTDRLHLLFRYAPFCDELWIAIREDQVLPDEIAASFVGILRVKNNEVQVERETKSSNYDRMGCRTGEMAKALLVQLSQL
jgi:hypothetical protein